MDNIEFVGVKVIFFNAENTEGIRRGALRGLNYSDADVKDIIWDESLLLSYSLKHIRRVGRLEFASGDRAGDSAHDDG